MEVQYLYMQGLQGISSFLEEEFYEVERNISFNKTEVGLKASQSLFIYGFISLLVFFILFCFCTACYYHFKTFPGNGRESTEDESNSIRSSVERQSTQSNNICTTSAEDGIVSYKHFSDESIFDGGVPNSVPTSCVELQRRRNAEIENSVRLAYGIDPIDLSKVSPKESDDCSVFQTAINESQTSVYYIVSSISGDEASTASKCESVSSASENKSLGSGRQSSESDTNETYLHTRSAISENKTSSVSISDNATLEKSCPQCHKQRKRSVEIENAVRLAYGIEPIDLSKLSPEKSDDCSTYQTAINQSQIPISYIVSNISGVEASSASKFERVSSVSENKSLGSGSQSLESDTNKTYLDTRSAISENKASSVSISDNATLEKSCLQCHRQRRRSAEIENAVRLAYGIDPIDLSNVSLEESDDSSVIQAAIKDSEISLSDIVSSISGDDVSSASIFESVSSVSESKSSESDTSKMYLDTRTELSESNTSSVSISDNATLEKSQSNVSVSHRSACSSTSLDKGSKGDLSLHNKDSMPKGDAPESSSETYFSTVSKADNDS